jgi:hypothetical protein
MRLSKSQKELLARATENYERNLTEILPYLTSRGITEQTARIFRLGFVREPEIGHEPYAGKLAIPYLTPTGVIDIRFRSLNAETGPKYMSRPGATTHIFNINALGDDSDVLAICEGELDLRVLLRTRIDLAVSLREIKTLALDSVEVGDKDKLASAVSLVWQVYTLTYADVC